MVEWEVGRVVDVREVDNHVLFSTLPILSRKEMASLHQLPVQLRIPRYHLPDNGPPQLKPRQLIRQRSKLGLQVRCQVAADGMVLLAVVEDVRAEEVAGGDVGVLDQVEHDGREDGGREGAGAGEDGCPEFVREAAFDAGW